MLWRELLLKAFQLQASWPLLLYHSFFVATKYQVLKQYCRYACSLALQVESKRPGLVWTPSLDFQFLPFGYLKIFKNWCFCQYTKSLRTATESLHKLFHSKLTFTYDLNQFQNSCLKQQINWWWCLIIYNLLNKISKYSHYNSPQNCLGL